MRLRDESVGVGGVAHDQDPHIVRCAGVECLALGTEDSSIGLEEISALHPGSAGARSHEQGDVDAIECHAGVVGDVDAGQQREGAVVQFHGGALCGLQGRADLQHAQSHGHVRPQKLP